MKKISPYVFAKANVSSGLPSRIEVVNLGSASEPAEIVIEGKIGKDWWDGSGTSSKDFNNALSKIPSDREITVRINSEGGSVKDGLGIYNSIKARRDKITCRVDGYAVSIASVLALGGKKVVSPKSSIWMIHEPWSMTAGNAEDHEKAAKMLNEHGEMLAEIYAEETGKTKEEVREAMKKETWLRGSEAVDFGLADECDDEEASLNAFDLTPFKNIPKNIFNQLSALPTQGERKNENKNDTIMNRTQKIALLNGWGINVKDEANVTDARFDELIAMGKTAALAALEKPANVVDINAEIQKGISAATKAMRREGEAEKALAKLVSEKRITQAQADKALPSILAESGDVKDSVILATLRENPVMPEAAAPLAPEAEITGDASVLDIANGIRKTHEATKAWQRGNGIAMKALAAASIARANIIQKHAAKLAVVMNAGTNTIDAALKRDVILQTVIVDFARRTMPLRAFSTVFSNVPLEGTNKVQVPFYDLDAGASTSFKGADGYIAGDTETDNREIQVGKRADADVLDDTKQFDRKYQALSFTSEELARQPYLNTVQLARLKAEKLASDIVAHVLSIITAANYGAAAITKAAALFNSDDLAAMKVACKLWPEMGRSLILDSAYDASLLKDAAFKSALNAASDSAIKEGRLNPRVFGFDYMENPTIPENGENLVGFAAFVSAILFAQAPVPPSQEVRNDGTTYSIVTDPQSGVSFEYRTFGDSQADKGVHVIEASYGFAKGNGNALKRIVSA